MTNMRKSITLRTDAGTVLGEFRNVREARCHADKLSQEMRRHILVIQSVDGVILSRLWPSKSQLAAALS